MTSWGGFFELGVKEKKISELEQTVAQPGFWQRGDSSSQKTMTELSNLKDVVARWKSFKKDFEDIEAHWQLASEMGLPAGEAGDATELGEIERSHAELSKKLDAFDLESKLSGELDKSNAIVSLHAGAGGTEACDWNDMIFRMYQRWANAHGYGIEITDMLPGEEAGMKSVTFFIKGPFAYGYMKSEIGVHRLVRISPFDSNKRRHTSFASCDVIPEIDDSIQIDINESDLKVDTYRSSGAGGQHVNKTSSAVRITHLATNIVSQCQNERSQFQNKQVAMKVLKARLYERYRQEKDAELKSKYGEKKEIAWGSQIRSYVFHPYTMVKDHRTGVETSNTQAVMDGDLDAFIQAYLKQAVGKQKSPS